MSSKGMSCTEFAQRALNDGYTYDASIGHILSPKGKRVAKMTRNGYCTFSRQIDSVLYTFCEHRVIWAMVHGSISDDKEINHRDLDKCNNRIDNLELVSHSENIKHAVDGGRFVVHSGEDNAKSNLSNRDAQLIRYLCAHGWKQSVVAELFDLKNVNTVSRVVTGARYGKVPDAATVTALYPLLVNKTMNHDLADDQQLSNAVMGLAGEVGEVVDILKKHLYQGHELDVSHLIEEVGDVLYYATLLMITLDIDMADAMFANMDKLLKRYPNGFSAERSIHREEGDTK